MQVELLTNGGYLGLDPCIGKVFTTLSDDKIKGSVRIPVAYLELAGFNNVGDITTSLYFFDWEVRVIDG